MCIFVKFRLAQHNFEAVSIQIYCDFADFLIFTGSGNEISLA